MFLFYLVYLAIHFILNAIFISISYSFTCYFPRLSPQTYLFPCFTHFCFILQNVRMFSFYWESSAVQQDLEDALTFNIHSCNADHPDFTKQSCVFLLLYILQTWH